MIIIVAHEQKEWRAKQIATVLAPWKESEPIVLDDTSSSITDMEGYCYPSLFSLTVPVVHAKFLLMSDSGSFDTTLAKKLSTSPTVFLFEEFSTTTPVATLAKKHGAIVHTGEKIVKQKKENDFFTVTNILTASDKKARWMAYRAVLATQPIESFIGILYWKARQMKIPADKKMSMYEALLDAQARAWQTGAPLELLIEKVILEY